MLLAAECDECHTHAWECEECRVCHERHNHTSDLYFVSRLLRVSLLQMIKVNNYVILSQ